LRQIDAFPVRLVSIDPPNLASVDAAWFGTGDNGLDYCVKTIEKTPHAPAAELICYRLAGFCNLAVPQFDLVEVPGGTVAFGSVWDGSAANQQASFQVLQGQTTGKEVARTLSRIYAFDLFVHNVDRHPGNYLCVGGRGPGHAIKAYDFSRAFTTHGWPLPSLPMDPSMHTVQTYRNLRRIHLFELSEALGVLKKMREIPVAAFKVLIESLPDRWLAAKTRKQVIKWWAVDRATRIDRITGGLKDGSFL
jgi:hypothetical protein